MERKVGEIFTYENKTYKVIKGCGCIGCSFVNRCYNFLYKIHGNCSNLYRKDNISVVFKEVKKCMEIKNNQLTIEVPEGMEIDLENSNLVNGIIKFKKKQDITYSDVYNELNDTDISVNTYFGNEIKLKALVKLMNIAKYYNNDWQPNWSNSKENKYCIKFDYHKDRFYVDYNNSIGAGDVFFKNSEDARAVINNPNFKSILNTIYKN
nr:MAG TPA: hypothetical protein [Caudoviricetes sp.]